MTEYPHGWKRIAAPSRCSVCKHPDHADYELKILNGLTQAEAAEAMNVDRSAVSRHMTNCLPRKIQDVAKPEPVETVMNVINALAEQYAIVQDHLKKAIDGGTIAEVATMLKEGRKHIELHARLTGQLTGPSNQINLMMNPDFIQLRATIINSLDPVERSKLSAKLLAAADMADIADTIDEAELEQ